MIDFSSIEKPVVIELSKLKKWDDNPREISQQSLEDVKYKIQKYSKFLQGHPLWITPDKTEQGKYIVFGGNQRLEAAMQLGWDKIPAIIFENITEKEMKEAALIDNKTDGVWKFPVLKEKFKDIDFTKLGFPDLNFTPKQIEFQQSSFIEEPTQEDTSIEADDDKLLLHEKNDKFCQKINNGSLIKDFVIAPFPILDCKNINWMNRKQYWKEKYTDGKTRDNLITNSIGLNVTNVSCSLLDPVLCEVVCDWFLPDGSCNVFDCFAGGTGFGFVSSYLGHNFTGIELRKEQCEENEKQCEKNNQKAVYHCDSGLNVDKYIPENSQDLFFSCPPYFNLEKYSKLPEDLSNMSYNDFIKSLDIAFTKSIKCLKNNRFAIIVMSDVRNKENGGYYTICDEIRNIFKKNGCIVYNEVILATQLASAPFRARRSMMSRKIVRVHQEVLCFYKGDTNEIKNIFPLIKTIEDNNEEGLVEDNEINL